MIKQNFLGCWAHLMTTLRELGELTLLNGFLKKIEGLFGGGVLMYFLFLKWLFLVNCLIFVLVFFFIIIPQLAFHDDTTTSYATNDRNTSGISRQNIERADMCSARYVVHPYNTQPVIDFLLGTGWMEKKIAFYGAYKDNAVLMSTTFSYNLPLAYILVALSYFLLSLILVVRQTANTIRDKLVGAGYCQQPHCRVIFITWEYRLSDENSAAILQNNIVREIKAMTADKKQEATNTLWFWRGLVNVLVTVILALACYLIFLVITTFIKVKKGSDYKNKTPFEQLILSFMTSLTITGLNVIVPFAFKLLVKLEEYSFAGEVNLTILRTVILKLASLVVLIYTIYEDVSCSSKDECQVGTGDCSQLPCWETNVGQEFYKLVLVDAFAVITIVLFYEFPRKRIVTRVKGIIDKDSCLHSILAVQEFDISKNILDLIYMQVLVWFGTLFAPMIPLVTVLKLILVFFLKTSSLLYNFKPSSKTYRAADSHFFVQIVLLGAYIVCIMPIMYVVWSMPPSTGCGPFRSYDFMYQIMSITIQYWPRSLKGIADFLASTAFSIPAFITLLLVMYYMKKMMNTYEQMNDILKNHLHLEKEEKKYLVKIVKTIPPTGGQSMTEVVPGATNNLSTVSV